MTSPYESASDLVASVGVDTAPSLHAGFEFLQRHLGGLDPGDVVTVAGRTNAGKSHLVLALLRAFAAHGMPALYVSCEDGRRRVARRLRGHVVDGLYITFSGMPSSTWLVAEVERAAAAGIRVFCVDYFQLIRYTGTATPYKQSDMYALALAEVKRATAAHDMVLVLVSQTTRPQPGESEELPRLFEMKESAALENAADVVLIVGDVKGRPTVAVAKAKDAPRGARFALIREPDGSLREPTEHEQRKQTEEARGPRPGPAEDAVAGHDDW